jgi:cytochrome c biogenesis protein CcmG, thiol:disulfide interchange protein DsbE
MTRFLIPLAVFLLLVVFLAIGLKLNPREVPSPLINKPAPQFSLPQLREPGSKVSIQDFRGEVWVLNVFASWCTPCLQEHPHLMTLSQSKAVMLVGFNYKDGREAALEWLAKHGDPYSRIVVDPDGRVGIDFGVYGVPETFVIDREGIIRFKHVGPLTPEVIDHTVVPLVKKLQS